LPFDISDSDDLKKFLVENGVQLDQPILANIERKTKVKLTKGRKQWFSNGLLMEQTDVAVFTFPNNEEVLHSNWRSFCIEGKKKHIKSFLESNNLFGSIEYQVMSYPSFIESIS